MKWIRLRVFSGFILGLLIFTGSCNKNDEVIPGNVPENIRSVNNFIWQNMDVYYLWRDFIPSNLDPDKEPDPTVFFDKFIYKVEDKWSYITDDYQSLINHFSGINYAFGHNFKLFHDGDTDRVFGVVEYVVEGTPADIAGLKRGVVFNTIDGVQITVEN